MVAACFARHGNPFTFDPQFCARTEAFWNLKQNRAVNGLNLNLAAKAFEACVFRLGDQFIRKRDDIVKALVFEAFVLVGRVMNLHVVPMDRENIRNDPALEKSVQAAVDGYADRVLDGARLTPGTTLADIGTGTGAVAFRAIDRIGKSLRVLLTDISEPLLRHAQSTATQRDVLDQCTFFQAPADDLREIPDACVDAVTTRAVLAYVGDKCAALREFHRILRPGGRVSIAEPILQDDAFDTIALKRMVDARGSTSEDDVLSLIHRWKARQFPDTPEKLAQSPIANYSERDLLGYFRDAGFVEIHLELHINVGRADGIPWETFLRGSPHPWAPTLGAILQAEFTPSEKQVLENALRPTVEAGSATAIDRIVYLRATKPN